MFKHLKHSMASTVLFLTACGASSPTSDIKTWGHGSYTSEKMTVKDSVKEHDLLGMCADAECEQFGNDTSAMYVFPNEGETCVFQTPKRTIGSGTLNKATLEYDVYAVSPKVVRDGHQVGLRAMNFRAELIYRDRNGILQVAQSHRHSINIGGEKLPLGPIGEAFDASEKYPLKDLQVRICLDNDMQINAAYERPASGFHAWTFDGEKYPSVKHVIDMRKGPRVIHSSNQLFVFAIYEATLQYK